MERYKWRHRIIQPHYSLRSTISHYPRTKTSLRDLKSTYDISATLWNNNNNKNPENSHTVQNEEDSLLMDASSHSQASIA